LRSIKSFPIQSLVWSHCFVNKPCNVLMYTLLLSITGSGLELENDRAERPAPPAPHFPSPLTWALDADRLGQHRQGFRGLAHSVRPNLFSQWNGNTIYRSTRGRISKRTAGVGATVLEGAGSTQPYQTNPPRGSCAPSSSHACHRRCAKTHSRRLEATSAVESRPRRSHGIDQKAT
jgi:hypothetical protein